MFILLGFRTRGNLIRDAWHVGLAAVTNRAITIIHTPPPFTVDITGVGASGTLRVQGAESTTRRC